MAWSNGGNGNKNSATSKNSGTSSKKPKKAVKKKNMRWKLRIATVLIVGIVLAVGMLFENSINQYLRLKDYIEEDYSGMSTTAAVGGGVVSLGAKLNIHFVDVGQGDACIVELPDQKKMIIDGGTDKDKQKLLDYIEENIVEESQPLIFDYAILTHSDEDHCGGLDDVFRTYSVGTFYRPNQQASYKGYVDPGLLWLRGGALLKSNAKDTLAYMRAIDDGYKAADKEIVTDATDISQNRIKSKALSETDDQYYEINFYTPTKDTYKKDNNYSPVIILSYQNRRIALSGDAEKEAEDEFVSLASSGEGRYSIFSQNVSVDIIKLGHHGSKTSSSEAYLATLTRASNIQNVIVVISCGVNNSHGHPHDKTMTTLKNMGFSEANILRTDCNGNIAMSIRQDESGSYQMYQGAELVRKNYNKPFAYREIAIALFVFIALVLLIYPLYKKHSKKRR